MTVCIAIACDCNKKARNPKLIFVSDTLLSLGYTSVAMALKARKLREGWTIMFAGEDISHASDVIDSAGALIAEKTEPYAGVVADSVTSSYQVARRTQLENLHLKTYGIDMAEFVRKGKNMFPESHHLNLLYEMERFDLGCEFLVAGFSSERANYPCIFTVQNPGIASVYDNIGYCAIGSGSINAMAYLARREQDLDTFFERSIYNAIAAKYLAEKATGVGPHFHMVIHENGKPPYFPDSDKINAITKIWLEEEQHYSPPNLESRITEIWR